MSEKPRASFAASRELLDEMDDRIIQKKAAGELPRDVTRSDVLRMLSKEWTRGNLPSTLTGTPEQTTTVTAN